MTLGIWVSATSTLTGRLTCFIKGAVASARVVISPYVVLVEFDVLFHFLFLFNPFFRFSSGVLTLISGALLLAELKLSAVLSSKFSHDSTGGWGFGGVGGCLKGSLEQQQKRLMRGRACLVSAVSLRVFLVWRIAVVTHREENTGWLQRRMQASGLMLSGGARAKA